MISLASILIDVHQPRMISYSQNTRRTRLNAMRCEGARSQKSPSASIAVASRSSSHPIRRPSRCPVQWVCRRLPIVCLRRRRRPAISERGSRSWSCGRRSRTHTFAFRCVYFVCGGHLPIQQPQYHTCWCLLLLRVRTCFSLRLLTCRLIGHIRLDTRTVYECAVYQCGVRMFLCRIVYGAVCTLHFIPFCKQVNSVLLNI